MKTFLTFIACLLLMPFAYAQAPPKMSYQALVRNSSGALLAGAIVGVQYTLYQGDPQDELVVYCETQTVTTNENGLMNAQVGAGAVEMGSLENVDWSDGPYHLKTDIDPNGGNDYSISGMSQVLSVPYALYAETSGSSVPGPEGPQGPPGMDGINGMEGISAYEVWLSLGNTGSQADFISSLTGPEGPQGPPGMDGLNGTDGMDGAAGPQGPEGPQGPPGMDGLNGTDGMDGVAGPQGPEGPQGLPGMDGLNGTDGIDGAAGPQGSEGPQGPPGMDGLNGTDGMDGAAGPQGPPGMDGMNGMDGLNGTDGMDGAPGPQGPEGPQGIPGMDGLNGMDGMDGAPGPQGPMGPQGLPGPQGPAGSANISGNSGRIIKFNGTTSGGNSIMTESGSTITIDGYIKTGTQSFNPALKFKDTELTTASAQGGTTSVQHFLDANKIISVTVLVNGTPDAYVAQDGYYFNYYFNGTHIFVELSPTNSFNILNQTAKIVFMVQE